MLTLERLGNTDKALEQYREVVAQHPDAPYATRASEHIRSLRTQ